MKFDNGYPEHDRNAKILGLLIIIVGLVAVAGGC